MPPINLMIKPASSNCNLRCKYCFYHSIAENRQIGSYGTMEPELLEMIVKNALEYADTSCTFAFQGGEPTLAGLPYYEKLIEFQHKYNVKKVKIYNALQTNGILIDDNWARFLAANKFLVGLSLDGPKDIHDLHRLSLADKGSFSRVMETVALFNKHQVDHNILCVVTAHSARHIGKIYGFFKKHHFQYLQFIPCLDPLGEARGERAYSLTPEKYATFLKALFDQWHHDVIQGNGISVRYFDNIVGMFIGMPPEACDMMGKCCSQFVVEADGGVYPCDFYVIDKWHLGNVKNASFEELGTSAKADEFIESSLHVDPQCKSCVMASLCRGGCRRNREALTEGALELNYYCRAYQEFFNYAGPRFDELAKGLSHRPGGLYGKT